MQNKKFILFLYIITLQVLDILTTYLAISRGAKEANPIVSLMLSKPILFLMAKIAIAIIVYVITISKNNRTAIIIYSLLMIQAIMVNVFNSLH